MAYFDHIDILVIPQLFPDPLPNPRPPPLRPFLRLIYQFQFVLPIFFQEWSHPLKHGQHSRGCTLKGTDSPSEAGNC